MTTPPLFVATLLTLGLIVGPAQAQLPRTFVSAAGNDANTCARTAPCRSLQVAHDRTSAGGEINMLDPAGYGVVTITKSISIVNDGVGSAGVLVPAGGTGITINAAPTDIVNLRGLIIEGTGVGQYGIEFNSGKSLTMENCVVRHLTQNGIHFVPNTSSSLAVSNTLVADNGNIGIIIYPSGSGIVNAVFNRVEVYANGNQGIFVSGGTSTGTIDATVADSVAARNANSGFIVSLPGIAAGTSLMVVRSVSANNGTGISSNGGASAIVRVSQSTVTGNVYGWLTTSGGVLVSYGDNNIDGNDNNETPPPTIARK